MVEYLRKEMATSNGTKRFYHVKIVNGKSIRVTKDDYEKNHTKTMKGGGMNLSKGDNHVAAYDVGINVVEGEPATEWYIIVTDGESNRVIKYKSPKERDDAFEKMKKALVAKEGLINLATTSTLEGQRAYDSLYGGRSKAAKKG